MIYKTKYDYDKDNGTTYSNKILHSKTLKIEEYGLLIYLLSNKPDWEINIRALATHFNCAKNKIENAIKGLKAKGYMNLRGIQNSEGRFVGSCYDVYENPEENKSYKSISIYN